MNVKMNVTVDIDDVPKRVTEEFRRMATDANTIEKGINSLSHGTPSPIAIIHNINDIRKQLVFLDSRLGDCYDALQGYCELSFSTEPEQPVQPPAQHNTAQNASEANMPNEMVKKIDEQAEALRQMYASMGSYPVSTNMPFQEQMESAMKNVDNMDLSRSAGKPKSGE